MNWIETYHTRNAQKKSIEKQIKQLEKELKSVGTTTTKNIIGEAVASKLGLHFRLWHDGLGFFSRNHKGHYHENPDYQCQISGIDDRLEYYDQIMETWMKLPEDTDEIAELILQERIGWFPKYD